MNLVTYLAVDVGMLICLFVTTDDADGKAKWNELRAKEDFRYPKIYKRSVKFADTRIRKNET